jgi:hypothetical protein
MATTFQPNAPPPPPARPPSSDVEALIEEARRRQHRRRLRIVIALALGATAAVGLYLSAIRTGGANSTAGAPSAAHLCVNNEPGWKSRSVKRPGTAPALLLTNFRFGRTDDLNGHTDHQLHWPHGGILISISDWTPAATSAMRAEYRPTSQLQIAARDFSSFEGVSNLGRHQLRLNDRLLEVWVQAHPTTAATIAAANRVLGDVRVCG